tara:strand:- start:4305 stop:5123 length:819 start_codon:yes stop_codon:yes gene_type:complete
MVKRHELAEEIRLRKNIRRAVGVVMERRQAKRVKALKEERQLRGVIRKLINEADPAVSTAAVHRNTGINALEDLFKNTNLLTTLRQGYKSLTSKKEQRESYKNHILSAAEMSLEVENSLFIGDSAAPGTEASTLQEQDVNIDIGAPEDNPAFIDVEKKEPSEEEEVEGFSLKGQDRTGRNRAYTDYKNVEKNIITAYDNLDDPDDRDMFSNYLLTNLKLYFDRFEEELQADLPEPDIDIDPADLPSDAPAQDPLNVDVEEMLEWLVLDELSA